MLVFNRKRKYHLMILFVLFIMMISMVSAGTMSKKIVIEDVSVEQPKTEDISVIKPKTGDNIKSTAISPDVGENPENPITLVFNPQGNVEVANQTQQFNATNTEFWFVFTAEEASRVSIQLILLPVNGSRPKNKDLGFDLFSDNFEFIISGNAPPEFDEYEEFITSYTGIYYLTVTLYQEEQDNVDYNLIVTKSQAGEIQTPVSRHIDSIGHGKALDILNYLIDENILNSNYQINLKSLDRDPEHFIKGASLAIIGLLRSAEDIGARQIAAGNSTEQALNQSLPLLYVAHDIMRLINRTRLSNGLYYVNNTLDIAPQNSTSPTNLYVRLLDNVYAMYAMVELWQFEKGMPTIGYPGNLAMKTQLEANINNTLIAVNDNFNVSKVFPSLKDRILVDEIQVDTSGNLLSISRSASLESLALMVQVLSGVKNLPTINSTLNVYNSEQKYIYDYVLGNFTIVNVGTQTLKVFTGVDTYEFTTRTKGSVISLAGEAYLLDMITPQVGVNDFYIPVEYDFVKRASDFAYDILDIFMQDNGLLSTQVTIASGAKSPVSNLYEHNLIMNSLYRISATWRFLETDPANSDLDTKEISRTWIQACLNIFQSVESVLYDSQNKNYFAQYDDATNTKYNIGSEFEKNGVVAGLIYLDYLSTSFSYQVYMEVPKYTKINVDSIAIISINILELIGSWTYFRVHTNSSVYATISSDEIGFSTSQTIDLSIFNFDSGFIPFSFTPKTRGKYSLNLQLSQEGVVLLSGKIKATALGEIRPEFNFKDFEAYTDDSSFSASLSLIDSKGLAISDLEVESVLNIEPGATMTESEMNKYYSKDRTDASGSIDISFTISSLLKDFNLEPAPGEFDQVLPDLYLPIFINATNARKFYFAMDQPIVIPLHVKFATMSLIINPNFLEIVQGRDEDYSFSVEVVNQESQPVSLARVGYSIGAKNNSITTSVDGTGTITLNGNELFKLQPPFVNISITIIHSKYPVKHLVKPLSIIENEIVILANPINVEAKTKAFYESSVSKVSMEVSTEDKFRSTLTANVSLSWAEDYDLDYDLGKLGVHLSPYTFEIDPAQLPEGEYLVNVTANRSGLGQQTVVRRIVIIAPTLYEAIVSALLIYGGYILTKLLSALYGFALSMIGITMECPNCHQTTKKKNNACEHCGNPLPGKSIDNILITSGLNVPGINTQTQNVSSGASTKSEDDLFKDLPEIDEDLGLKTEPETSDDNSVDESPAKNLDDDLPDLPSDLNDE